MIKSYKTNLRSDGDYDYAEFYLVCDKCHKSFSADNPPLMSFDDAVKYKKQIGFRSLFRNNKWYEFCPDCTNKIGEVKNGR